MSDRGTQQSFLMQPLESRTLLSAAPFQFPPGLGPIPTDNPTIQADLDQLKTDLKTLHTDTLEARHALTADSQAVDAELEKLRASDANLSNELAPLKQQVKNDTKALRDALKPGYQAIEDLRDNFTTILWADRKALRDAKEAGDSDAAAAARAKLQADGEDYSNQLHDLRAKLVADAQPFKEKIKADKEAIWDKLIELNPDVGPLVDKLRTDQVAFADKLKADQALVQVDLEKLKQDRDAAASAIT